MLPIRDVNPTAVRPVVTFGLQPQESPAADEFAYKSAAIACELTTNEPLDAREIRTGQCIDGQSDPLFPTKSLPGSVVLSMFLHAGIAHLGFNMWSLWIFGNNVEEAFGRLGYLAMYVLAGIAATVGFVTLNPDLTVPLVGASGAIAGVMGAYLVLFPRHHVMTLIFIRIVAVPAIVFLGIWFVSQFVFTDGSVAWEAHVVGFLFGAAITLPFRRRLLAATLAGRSELVGSY
jgi:membrane associated rhomboid family serine protease